MADDLIVPYPPSCWNNSLAVPPYAMNLLTKTAMRLERRTFVGARRFALAALLCYNRGRIE